MIKITYEVDANGNVRQVDALGLGNKCQEFTADIERLLGKADEASREQTAAFHELPDMPLNLEQ